MGEPNWAVFFSTHAQIISLPAVGTSGKCSPPARPALAPVNHAWGVLPGRKRRCGASGSGSQRVRPGARGLQFEARWGRVGDAGLEATRRGLLGGLKGACLAV